MPFFDGTTLVFCQAGTPLEKTIVNKGTIWKNMRHNSVLAERFKNLPRSQKLHYRAWKLAYCNWNDKIIHPIETGLPEDGIECSPSFYQEGGQVYLSFIGGAPSDIGLNYRLYVSSGPDLEHLEPAKLLPNRPTFFGFVSPYHVCWGVGDTLALTEKGSENNLQFKSNFARILRVTFLSVDPAKLLITGVDKRRQYRTVLHDLSTGNTSDVSAEGAVYKSSIHEDRVIFAKTIGSGIENRELYHGGYALLPSAIQLSAGK